jgi:predicted phosphodiesterase
VRVAVISDVHGNLEALEAVLADIERARVDRIVCLGDMVGYGPNPGEVCDVVAGVADAVVKGNHEMLVLGKAIEPRISPLAVKSTLWTRSRLTPRGSRASERKRKRWDWLRKLPRYWKLGDIIFAHGSPNDAFHYILGPEDALKVFETELHGAKLCLVGHTHVPGFFVYDGRHLAFGQAAPGRAFRFRNVRAIVNVGSVGQPRDQDPRACYAIIGEDRSFEFRRVEYDAELTARKIYAIEALPAALGERLLLGE